MLIKRPARNRKRFEDFGKEVEGYFPLIGPLATPAAIEPFSRV